MTRRFYLVAFVGAGLGLTALAAEPAAFATSMTRTLHLHGGMYAPKAMATARITQTAPADYRVQIIAEGLPAADMLVDDPYAVLTRPLQDAYRSEQPGTDSPAVGLGHSRPPRLHAVELSTIDTTETAGGGATL